MAVLCETYGFDDATRAARLEWVGLCPSDHDLVGVLQRKIIAPHVTSIIESFYEGLGHLPDFWRVIRGGGFSIRRLKRSQLQYAVTLGRDFDTEGYFETRLRVGLAHVRAGVSLSLYQSTYGMFQRILVGQVERTISEADLRQRLIDLVLKLTTLDMAMAIEVYHLARIRGLERSLEQSRVAEREMRTRASRDSLTGLSNRDFIMDALDRALVEARERRMPLCVIMADLDHFKRVNDTHGHLVGDEVLRHVTGRMSSVLRGGDVLGRYGGEEFLIILTDTALVTALRISGRIRVRVEEEPLEVGALTIPMTISQGLAEAGLEESAQEVIRRADAALYQAKQKGRNRVEVAPGPPVTNHQEAS